MNMFVEALSGSGGIDAVTYAPQRKKIWEMDQVFRCPVVGPNGCGRRSAPSPGRRNHWSHHFRRRLQQHWVLQFCRFVKGKKWKYISSR